MSPGIRQCSHTARKGAGGMGGFGGSFSTFSSLDVREPVLVSARTDGLKNKTAYCTYDRANTILSALDCVRQMGS